MIKAGIIGVGHLGKIHLKLLNVSKKFELVGYHDLKKLDELNNFVFFKNVKDLIINSDAIFICTNTPYHYEYAQICLNLNKHIFIEKPITSNIKDAETLLKLSSKKKLKIQVGHVERFNAGFQCIKNEIKKPKFIECHRLAEFNPRGNDVSVVLDLMIHDIDIVLSLIRSKPKVINANAVCVINDTPDICNARVEFESGEVANFTASRISQKNMRKSRFFQSNAYISVDFLNKKTEVVKIRDYDEKNPYSLVIENSKGLKKEIFYENPTINENNAIQDEHDSFAKSINLDKEPEVSATDGYNALKLANQIIERL